MAERDKLKREKGFPEYKKLRNKVFFKLVRKASVYHHAFADNQLYKISTLDAIHQSIETLQNCTTDVKSWMTANFN